MKLQWPKASMPQTKGVSPFSAEAKERLMREAIKEAIAAQEEGEVPAGAVVASADGTILGRGHNRVVGLSDPSAHAEILALRAAAAQTGNYRLTGLVLASTLEPCAMCLSCALQARLKGILYGAVEPKWGAHKSLVDLNAVPGMNHAFDFIVGGILQDECRDLVQAFFRARRGKALKGDA
jgi:tRNA(adenine34) deaminase